MQILTFGNNITGALSEDVTAQQTTLQLLQGQGDKFRDMLSTDYENPTVPLTYFAKLTLTNSSQNVHEIVHLTGVSNDTLTVVRGREGTKAQGWKLGDFVGNMSTRGAENTFVQIGQLQAAFYNCGKAAGTANGLTLQLPTDFFENDATEWELNAPLVVIPTLRNTAAATLQITLGSTTVGTFPLYKGNQSQLSPGDILPGVPLLCLLNKSEGYITVVNPSAIYSALGTAAFKDIQTSQRDLTAGRIPLVGNVVGVNGGVARAQGGTVTDCNALPANSVSFVYTDSLNGPGFTGTLLDVAGLNSGYRIQIAANYAGVPQLSFRCFNNDSAKTWSAWVRLYSPNNKPSPADIGAVPVTRRVNGYALNNDIILNSQDIFNGAQTRASLGTADLNSIVTPGLYSQNYDANATSARNYPQQNAGALVVIFSGVTSTSNGVTRSSVRQFYYPYNGQASYTRQFTGTSWGGWVRYYDTGYKPTPADIGAVPVTRRINGYALSADFNINSLDIFKTATHLGTQDLNAIRSPGLYYQPANANTSAARNYPVNVAGALRVYQAAGVVQLYDTYSGDGSYKRTFYDGSWSAWIRSYTNYNKPTPADIGAIPLAGSLNIGGTMRANSEYQSTSANSFRIAYGGRGTFQRNDGQNWYMMVTNANDPYGSYNTLRPLRFSLSTGEVIAGHNLSVGANFYVGGAATLQSVTINGSLQVKGVSTLAAVTAASLTCNGNMSVGGTTTLSGAVNIGGIARVSSEVQSTSGNSYRIAYNGRGTFQRNDGNYWYMMVTNPNDAYGNYNALRPISFNLSTGDLVAGKNLSVGGNFSVSGAATLRNVTINGSATVTGAVNATGNVTGQQVIPRNYSNFDGRYALKSTLSRSATGYHIDQSTGLITQWGIATRGGGNQTQINFPYKFPSACVNVQLTLREGSNIFRDQNVYVSGVTTSSFVYNAGSGEGSSYWEAKGW